MQTGCGLGSSFFHAECPSTAARYLAYRSPRDPRQRVYPYCHRLEWLDVNAVVAVGGMAHDSFVFFIEGVHGRPGKRDPSLQLGRVSGHVDVLPCPSWRTFLARSNGIPGREPKIEMPGHMLGAL